MRKALTTLAFLGMMGGIFAQEYYPKNDGTFSVNTNYTVIKNATIHTEPGKKIKKGTIIIQKGKIIEVGKNIKIPSNSVVVDAKEKHIYPSFVDAYTNFGIENPKGKNGNPFGGNPQYEATREGYYWNDHIRPETNSVDHFKYNAKEAKSYLKQGFGIVNTHVADGIARGTGMLVALYSEGTENERILKDRSSQFFSFKKSKKSRQLYPTSLMGSMALLRQVYNDLSWYSTGKSSVKDLALEALISNNSLPQIFEAGSRINSFRADKVGDEFGVQYILVGGGDEYARIDKVKQTNATYIIPLDFPDAYDVSDPYQASWVSLGDMKHWNQAPTNPSVLAEAQVPFSLTTFKLKKVDSFLTQLQKAIKHGLNKEKALEALTTMPAKILGQEGKIGVLKKGAYANLLITSNELFTEGNVIYENWVLGNRNIFKKINESSLNGHYTLNIGNETYKLKISGKASKPTIEVTAGSQILGSKITIKEDWLTILIKKEKSYIRLVAPIIEKSKRLQGKAILSDGSEEIFTAKRQADQIISKKKAAKKDTNESEVVSVSYPNIAYGNTQLPKKQTILFKDVTVWTNEAEGILETTDVLIKEGKIAAIGKGINQRGAVIVNAKGKHLTSGIIDEHSHIATAAVNEAGHNSTAEVTIEDVVDPNDIDIYRNLAGGVTSIQVLHGSANPIGGRSAILKLKWGETADKMIYTETPKFIKFALGENVKQSNWPSFSRFPQTRMGVEQLYIDYFTRAKEYEALKKSGKPFRKDEEMEVLVEILNGERYISCHSYVQSEINMLMKVAEKLNFKINTFTHILEGYKVADKMAAHGVGGSTFSDWWAYKYEVNDAIPYNATIMHNQGVTVAINSDDAEMSRRLNQEAAKSVKYGGMSEEEAWKLVTLNPAKLLHIEHRVGSIKVGKDADLVLWSGNPLSIYSKAEKTIIEGAVYFDINEDQEKRKAIKEEKNKLVAMMLEAKNKGLKTQPAKKKEKQHFECETIESIHH